MAKIRAYVCECGAVFHEPKAVEESRGEFWGMPCSETMYYCPVCGDDCFDEEEVDEDEVEILESDSSWDGYDEDYYMEEYYGWR